MFLFEDRLLVLTERERLRPSYKLQTVMIEVDASDPESLTVASVDSDAVMADGTTVYASAESLYVATSPFSQARPIEPTVVPEQSFEELPDDISIAPPRLPAASGITEIHRFEISAASETDYAGSGEVEGNLLNQCSISEYEGHLRVATTLASGAGDVIPPDTESQSAVTVLEVEDDGLSKVGKVDGLGRGKDIRAVRFVGEVGFVVTFRQIDPLYAIDISDPTDPVARGELKIPGFSAYLHPVGDERLLGVGQDAEPKTGMTEGTQVSLFDVSDLDDPARVAKLEAGVGTSSQVEFDARAFTSWPDEALVLVPVGASFAADTSPAADRRSGVGPNSTIVYEVGPDGELAERGRVRHADGNQPIDRTIALGDRPFTISDVGVGVTELEGDELVETGFVSYR